MRKALLTLALAMMAVAMGVQAQETNNYKWVAGGTAHFDQNRDMTAGNVSGSSVDCRVEPFVGYNINDHWRVGLTVGYGYNHTEQLDALGNLVDLGNKNTYRVGPYVHYNMVRYKRWILFAEAEAMFGYSPNFMAMNAAPGAVAPGAPGVPATPAATYDVKRTEFLFTIKPGVTFELDKHVNIDFNINLLGWMYANYKETRLDNNVVTTNTRNGLNLDILEGTLENYWRDITIGVTFKF